MKNRLLILIAITGTFQLHAQVPQIPLIEHFTQASCTPCASQNPMLKATLDSFGTTNYVRVTHQVSWPGVDPMNADFQAGPFDRVTYYNLNGVPRTTLNGNTPGQPNTIVTAATLAAASGNTTPYDITAAHSWTTANSVTVNIDVANVTNAPISNADRIYVSMVENDVNYASAPGSNGETSFEYVMRQMYNANTGAADATTGAVLGTLAANSTTNFNFTINNLPSYLINKENIEFAIYLQNDASQQIFQSGKTASIPIPGAIDASAISTTVADQGICDYNITPGVQVTNNDSTETITNIVAQYSIDGGTPVQQTFTGNLTSGQSTTITFPTTTLSGGTNTISTEILSINGTQNWVSPPAVLIEQIVYKKIEAVSTPSPLIENMESAVITTSIYTQDLPSALFESNLSARLFGVVDGSISFPTPVGGFGNSARSLAFRNIGINSGEIMNFTLTKRVQLGANSSLTFNHAYRQSTTQNDALSVLISTNCGATWTSVFNEAGATLSTITPSNQPYEEPDATDWRSNTVNLSAYDGMSDVIFRFQGISASGNNLFVDDINITSTLSTGDVASLNSVKLYPNPSTDFIQLSGLIDGTQNYTIYNILGAQIMGGTINENEKIDVKSFQDGIYILKLENGNNFKFIKE